MKTLAEKVNVALVIGRKGSTGFPGKNTFPVLGRPLAEYPMQAAKTSREIKYVFVSTDCPRLKKLGDKHGAILIKRPASLATKKALGEDVFKHGFMMIQKLLKKKMEKVEFIALLFANAPNVTGEMIDHGIGRLRKDPKADSAVSVSIYNMWSPIRARRLNKAGYLRPFVSFSVLGKPEKINCDRDSQGNVYFADMGLSVVRPRCLENLEHGLLPQKWMGKNILPIFSEYGCDVDYPWQIPQAEYWLKNHRKPKYTK